MSRMFHTYENLTIEKLGLTYLTNIRKKKKLQYHDSLRKEVYFDSRKSLKKKKHLYYHFG